MLTDVGPDHGRPGEEVTLAHSVEHASGVVQAAAFRIHADEFGVHKDVAVPHGGDGSVEAAAQADGVGVDAGLEEGGVGAGLDGDAPFHRSKDGFLEVSIGNRSCRW